MMTFYDYLEQFLTMGVLYKTDNIIQGANNGGNRGPQNAQKGKKSDSSPNTQPGSPASLQQENAANIMSVRNIPLEQLWGLVEKIEFRCLDLATQVRQKFLTDATIQREIAYLIVCAARKDCGIARPDTSFMRDYFKVTVRNQAHFDQGMKAILKSCQPKESIRQFDPTFRRYAPDGMEMMPPQMRGQFEEDMRVMEAARRAYEKKTGKKMKPLFPDMPPGGMMGGPGGPPGGMMGGPGGPPGGMMGGPGGAPGGHGGMGGMIGGHGMGGMMGGPGGQHGMMGGQGGMMRGRPGAPGQGGRPPQGYPGGQFNPQMMGGATRGPAAPGGPRPKGFGSREPALRRHNSNQIPPAYTPSGPNPGGVRRRGDPRPNIPSGIRKGLGGPSPYNQRGGMRGPSGLSKRHRSLPRSTKGIKHPALVPDPYTNPNAAGQRQPQPGRRGGPSPGSIRRIKGGPSSHRHIPSRRVVNNYQSNNALRGTGARFGAGQPPQVKLNSN